MKKLVIISDTHTMHNKLILPEGDFLIHCGDFSWTGAHKQVETFLSWFAAQPHKYKLFCAGNHDRSFELEQDFKKAILAKYSNLCYLEDGGTTIEGINFWGSPWQPEFKSWGFNLPRNGDELTNVWKKIPRNTDVLITHTPPQGVLDRCNNYNPGYPQNAGCEMLRHQINDLPNLKYHFFGHIHEARGLDLYSLSPIMFINASSCNQICDLSNRPISLNYETKEILDF